MISAFGLGVEFAFRVPELGAGPTAPSSLLPPGPPLRVELASGEELAAAWSGPCSPPVKAGATVDDSRWTAERGRDWDLRMSHQEANFHLDCEATLLRCAPRDAEKPAWRRLLLDTALVTCSLARGRDAIHAGCVVKAGMAIALAGASGAGKTTLLWELLRGGAQFLTDDVAVLTAGDQAVLAHPGPPLANLPAVQMADGLAEPLHQFGDEWWVRVPDPCLAPSPLQAVMVLEPVPDGAGTTVTSLSQTAAPLLGHALHGGSTPERRGERFALLAQLAEAADVVAVGVDRTRPVAELLEQLTEAVPPLRA